MIIGQRPVDHGIDHPLVDKAFIGIKLVIPGRDPKKPPDIIGHDRTEEDRERHVLLPEAFFSDPAFSEAVFSEPFLSGFFSSGVLLPGSLFSCRLPAGVLMQLFHFQAVLSSGEGRSLRISNFPEAARAFLRRRFGGTSSPARFSGGASAARLLPPAPASRPRFDGTSSPARFPPARRRSSVRARFPTSVTPAPAFPYTARNIFPSGPEAAHDCPAR